MAEWLKAHAWKACIRKMYHGFESHSLRFLGPVLSNVAKPRQDWKVAAVSDFFGEYASLRLNFKSKGNVSFYVKI